MISKYIVMTSKEYDNWMIKYNQIMDNPMSTDELLKTVEAFTDLIVIED